MRGADRGKRCRVWRHPQLADGVARIQTALGVCNNVDLFTARLLHHLQDLFSNVLCVIGDGPQRLLIAIIDSGP